jgi:pectate lyase
MREGCNNLSFFGVFVMKRISFLAGLITILCLSFTSGVFAAADGWASVSDANGTPYNLTGGAGGPTVTVTDEPNLFKYACTLTGPYIIQVSGTINIHTVGGDPNSLEIKANKTIRGIGTNPTLVGNVGFANRDGNIILENLNITNPHMGDAYDGISLKQDIHNVLVTKCTFYDTGDGAFDITNRSNYVTVSWCKFYYNNPAPVEDHRLACLVGSSDKQTDDIGKERVTYHHNWWANRVKERMPRVRYGKVHVYNNYYSNLDAGDGAYCIGVGCGSHIRVESNYFNTAPKLWENYYTGQKDCHSDGHIGWNTGNIFYNCSDPGWATNEYSTTFTPPYPYTLEDTNTVPASVQAYAGAGTPYPPHWYYTVYGDFDRSGKVDRKDLATLANYWLVTDCNAITDADYYPDCIVNFREFALMAESWLK